MVAVENPPGFLIRTEAQKAAWENGFRQDGEITSGWIAFGSTTAPAKIWIGASSPAGPWFLSTNHSGVAAELDASRSNVTSPGTVTYEFSALAQLYEALDRTYRLAVSLPEAPLAQFQQKTRTYPRSTEAERLIVQRIGQDIFRAALMQYWNRKCPLTGITDTDLLRASHIVAWADCDSDAKRLDVHNGLLLSALWDAAFDKGLVSFADDGSLLLSPKLSKQAREALNVETAQPLTGLTPTHRENLATHRTRHDFSSKEPMR